ncbi:hypothetical protein FRC10_008205 [Ceratobasidium sp. 414]|nr:hypothetical protein FRC10_008205 [Ceratobasidium sp. 414]
MLVKVFRGQPSQPTEALLTESGPLLNANAEKFISVMFITAKRFEPGIFPLLVKNGSKTIPRLPTLVSPPNSAMLNYYRTRKINFELEKTPEDYRPEMPKLLVIPVRDIALPPELCASAEREFENIEVVRFEGLCGHWVQLEMAAEVEKVVGEWVERMAAKGWVA